MWGRAIIAAGLLLLGTLGLAGEPTLEDCGKILYSHPKFGPSLLVQLHEEQKAGRLWRVQEIVLEVLQTSQAFPESLSYQRNLAFPVLVAALSQGRYDGTAWVARRQHPEVFLHATQTLASLARRPPAGYFEEFLTLQSYAFALHIELLPMDERLKSAAHLMGLLNEFGRQALGTPEGKAYLEGVRMQARARWQGNIRNAAWAHWAWKGPNVYPEAIKDAGRLYWEQYVEMGRVYFGKSLPEIETHRALESQGKIGRIKKEGSWIEIYGYDPGAMR